MKRALDNALLLTDFNANNFRILNLGDTFIPNLVDSDDPRLNDPRPVPDSSVTNAKVASDAGIQQSKLNLDSPDIPPTFLHQRLTPHSPPVAAQGNLVQPLIQKSQINGYAGLDANAKLFPAEMPVGVATGTMIDILFDFPLEFTGPNRRLDPPVTATERAFDVFWAAQSHDTWFGNTAGFDAIPVFTAGSMSILMIPGFDADKISTQFVWPLLPLAQGVGPDHAPGLVPDPNSTVEEPSAQSTDYLARDMTYKPMRETISYQPQVPPPSITFQSYFHEQSYIDITTSTPGANLFYEVHNQLDPPNSFVEIIDPGTLPLLLDPQTVVSAYAAKIGYNNSDIANFLVPLGPPCASPVFNPAGGAYPTFPKPIVITSATAGSTIYYRLGLGGLDIPGPDGTATVTVIVTAGQLVLAFARKSGQQDSAVVTATYTLQGACVTPSFNPVAGAYPTYPKTISISTTTAGAQMRYTTSGVTPSSTVGTLIAGTTGSVSVAAGQTLKAIAFKTDLIDSAVASGLYSLQPTCVTPTFNPVAGAYPLFPKIITISTITAGAQMRYTTNGTIPSSSVGTLIAGTSGTASVAAGQTLKAIAFKAGAVDSTVASGLYSQQPTAVTPTFSPVAGTYNAIDFPKTITITSAGNSIRYTTNGTTPTSTSGTLIASGGTASVAAGQTLKAIAFRSGAIDSAVASGVYAALAACATPALSPSGGVYTTTGPKQVLCSTSTTGAAVRLRYTTNGTTPSGRVGSNGTIIGSNSGNATITPTVAGVTLRVIAYTTDGSRGDSAVASGFYTLDTGG